MRAGAGPSGAEAQAASWRYVAPFAVFVAMIGLGDAVGSGPQMAYPARVLAGAAVLWCCSRRLVSLKLARPWASVLTGVAVFLVWIAPELLWPPYRGGWLFSNPLTGAVRSTAPAALRTDAVYLLFRVAGSALLVPVIEELFWRAWLMRWLISARFADVPLGTYAARAFWVTAILFALEHGAYWDVGLAAGLAYNAWMVRTRSLGDCILAHAVTNACLAAYVLWTGAWGYWL